MKKFIGLLLALVWIANAVPISADTLSDLQKQQNELKNSAKDTQTKLNETKKPSRERTGRDRCRINQGNGRFVFGK